MNIISGGVTAPKGLRPRASTAASRTTSPPPAGEEGPGYDPLRRPLRRGGTFTRNVVKADPVILTREHLADHKAQGIIFDSGNANACAPKGHGERPADGQGRRVGHGAWPRRTSPCAPPASSGWS